jgi:hypothetical protein
MLRLSDTSQTTINVSGHFLLIYYFLPHTVLLSSCDSQVMYTDLNIVIELRTFLH